jgi:hypothetical protein
MRSDDLAGTEYAVLRQTIAVRGTVRMALAAVTFIAWATLGLATFLYADAPIAAFFSLGALAGGFEAILMLHIGVERIGRFIQVFYEDPRDADGPIRPRWETTAMVGGPALPGGGTDPLFAIPFVSAVALNLFISLVPGVTPIEAGVSALVHMVVVVRVIRARRAAATQRAKDLDHYRKLRDRGLTPAADQ